MKIQKLGWILAAGMAGVMFAEGFQTTTTKVGVADVQNLFQNSDVTHNKQEELKTMGDSRSDVLQFIKTYRTITPDQAARFKTLSLKADQSPAEKTELDKLKADVIATNQSFQTLQTKASPTPDEVSKLQAFNAQAQQTDAMSQRWAKEFNDDMNAAQDKMRNDVLDKAQAAVQEVGKKQAYTVIFTESVAPYSSNDITADALKVMNAKK
jgi:Skp family chaperone for outer membrane proteins